VHLKYTSEDPQRQYPNSGITTSPTRKTRTCATSSQSQYAALERRVFAGRGGLKGGERCVEITRANDYHELSDLQSNQEEADTRMLLHAKYAASECLEINIVIQSPDTDVLVLCAAHFNSIAPKELWFRTGVKDHLCFIPIHEVCQQLSGRILKSLPAFHTLTGCDTPVLCPELERKSRGKC